MNERRFDGTFAGWRALARAALAAGEAPHQVRFAADVAAQAPLFAQAASPTSTWGPAPTPGAGLRLPRAFVAGARLVAVHSDLGRWDLLYRLAFRLCHGEPFLLHQPSDVDVLQFTRLQRAVLRDVHHCHAYVRFRQIPGDAASGAKPTYVAWYEPDYAILQLAAPHFVARFATMQWSILTPAASAHFANGQLSYGPGARRTDAPQHDALEALWRTYYAHIFNPARLNLQATRSEMPQRFWRNMPETDLIEGLRRTAPAQAQAFLDAQPPRAVTAPSYRSLAHLRKDLAGCQICPWSQQASQAVPGEGPAQAPLMLVGEQPGDQEDRRQRPFVGPAGEVLNRALQDAGLARADVYLTNAVKHFKFNLRGGRRLHQRPSATDVAACKGWLAAEVALVQPRVLVCLGATAALAVRGQLSKIKELHGRVLVTGACAQTLVTGHPSAILRAEGQNATDLYAELVASLRHAGRLGVRP